MKTPRPAHTPLGNRSPLVGAPSKGDGKGRFARLLALDDEGPRGAHLVDRKTERSSDQEFLRAPPGREKETDEPKTAQGEGDPPAVGEELKHRPVELQAPRQTDPGPASEAPSTAEPSPARQDVATMAQRMLRSVHVGQLPNGVKTLNLQVESGGKARIDVDLRLEAGKLRAHLGVAEAGAYRALDGKLAALQGALSARGIAAHPVRLDLRRERRAEPKQAERERGRASRGARRRGETVI
ncbi:MAG: hypothetical protein CSA65_03135 [Proteobacteria bacterium]|nr:MAG: hypothetical protein CSB49_04220 [Pseudomonadota bacterium]PIE19130.1 MAG: hypothetical protein CSA65_03135 [Pseudomonadota bacterium]